MTCDHADCHATATTRCRFGDGYLRMPGYEKKQTYVYYCDADLQRVAALFTLCDIGTIAAGQHSFIERQTHRAA